MSADGNSWETNEVCKILMNSSAAECNLSADELQEAIEDDETCYLSALLVQEIHKSLLSQALAQVDWDEVAKCVSDGSIACYESRCLNTADSGEAALKEKWLQDEDGDWFCPECREDFDQCLECYEFFPEETLVEGLCPECKGEDGEEEEEEATTPFKVGDLVDKPQDEEVSSYDYGEVTEILSNGRVNVCWFKYGYVPERFRTVLNVTYWGESTEHLTHVAKNIEPASYVATTLPSLDGGSTVLVTFDDTIRHNIASINGTVLGIFGSLKKPSIRYAAVRTEDHRLAIWDLRACRAGGNS